MSWTAEGYFAKAQAYWAKATSKERGSADFLMNVTFFCEFAVRGALCSVSPILNADKDEESLIYAAGGSPSRPPKTVSISIAIDRLSRLNPEITAAEKTAVTALMIVRNTELHGHEDIIGQALEADIMPKVYAFVTKLAAFSKQDLDVLLGKEDAGHAKTTAAAIIKDRRRRVSDLIAIHKDRFYSLPDGEQAAKREASKPGFTHARMTSGHQIRAQQCPSCRAQGYLGGSPVGRSGAILKDDGIYQEIRVSPDVFQCKCCDLTIKGLDELMAANFPHEFIVEDEVDVIEHFNIDPMEYVDTDQIIREYESERGWDAYQDE